MLTVNTTASIEKKTLTFDILTMEGDTIPDLLAWTRNQPTNKLAATRGKVWQDMRDFAAVQFSKLPDVVTMADLTYLRQSKDKKDWMLYTIIKWRISNEYNSFGAHERENRQRIFATFREIQAAM